MTRTALLSMDVEDWYHLEYFRGLPVNRTVSFLDGIERFAELLLREGVPATFFTLGDVARAHTARVRRLAEAGFEIASHGPDHTHLSQLSNTAFADQLRRSKQDLEDLLGARVRGYRAPCFSMTEQKLGTVAELGFDYDSSWIRFDAHPLYGQMKLSNWTSVRPGIHRAPDSPFLEFEVPTVRLGSARLPIAGGAYFRFFPLTMLRVLLRRFVQQSSTYILYVHPFECSLIVRAPYPEGTTAGTKLRFNFGRRETLPRISAVIAELRALEFEFRTFGQVTDALA